LHKNDKSNSKPGGSTCKVLSISRNPYYLAKIKKKLHLQSVPQAQLLVKAAFLCWCW